MRLPIQLPVFEQDAAIYYRWDRRTRIGLGSAENTAEAAKPLSAFMPRGLKPERSSDFQHHVHKHRRWGLQGYGLSCDLRRHLRRE